MRAPGSLYLQGFGGDVSNMAVAAARQGARVGLLPRSATTSLRAISSSYGIARGSTVRPYPACRERTGIYFIGYGVGGHIFSYFRKAGGQLVGPAELPLATIATARVLHISAISQAISESCAEACLAAIRYARSHGNLVCYDTNLRLKLWSLDRARDVIHCAVTLSDIVAPKPR